MCFLRLSSSSLPLHATCKVCLSLSPGRRFPVSRIISTARSCHFLLTVRALQWGAPQLHSPGRKHPSSTPKAGQAQGGGHMRFLSLFSLTLLAPGLTPRAVPGLWSCTRHGHRVAEPLFLTISHVAPAMTLNAASHLLHETPSLPIFHRIIKIQ